MWTPPTQLPNLSAAREIFVDIETNDKGLRADEGAGWPWRGGYVVGFAIGTLEREWYLPIRHEGGGNVDPSAVVSYMRDLGRVSRRWVFHNALYDLGWARTEGVAFEGEIHDTLAGAALLDEQRLGYDLDSCARDIGHAGKNVGPLVEAYQRLEGAAPMAGDWVRAARANLWRLHSRDVGEYAEGDISATRALWLAQAPLMANEALSALYRIECDILPLLTEMRSRGIRIDTGAAERLWDEIQAREKLAQRRMRYEFGARITKIRGYKEQQEVCDRLSIAYPRTKSGKPSFAKDWTSIHPHPFFRLLNHWRHLNTTRTLILEGGILHHLHDDRIYPELSPLRRDNDNGGAVSGRFSCSNPNTQQVGERSELGQQVRALYLPEEGELWHAADVSQQEPRLTVHYAVRLRLTRALEAARAFERDGADWHQIVADMVSIDRKTAKPINLGLVYGMGDKKLAASLGMSLGDARVVLQQYHANLPFVRELFDLCERTARERGYITTILGRRRRFPFWEADVRRKTYVEAPETIRGEDAARTHFGGLPIKRAFVRKSLNALIQGSAADWIKKAMVDLWRAGVVPMLQMHDELDTSVTSPEQGKVISEIVREAVTLRCPIVVDSGIGANWRDAKASA